MRFLKELLYYALLTNFEEVVIPFGGVQKDAFEYSKAEFVRDN